ncbi:MAG TPA: phosphate ABC transporter substrate-binding protein PstS [Acidimicrobiales bacterium]|nr:phosphate ABC transporter substrate-binding protein PstS [Acidimicrobiales bacterium]
MKRLIPLVLIAPLAVAACGSSSHTSSPTTAPAAPSSNSSATTGSSSGGTSSLNLGNPASPVTLNESGSSLLYPFLQELVDPLHSKYSNVTLAPAAGGSGKGISDAIAGTTQMGGSDAYLSNSQASANPGLLNIPIAISSQAVNYNVPGVSNLKLTGDVIAQIYQGKITKWNDKAIAALNPGTNLPSTTIVPVRRVDASGDTFIFTSFLSATNPAWQSGPAFGTSITWPAVSNELTANGNPGMVQTCQKTPGCIAYIGISSEDAAKSAGLGEAELQNKAGNYVQPDDSTVGSAVSAGAQSIPANLAAPIIYEPGAQSYPIVNFEYIIVKNKQSSADTAQAIRDFLAFAVDPQGGSSSQYLAKEHFVGLPSSVIPQVQKAIATIQG